MADPARQQSTTSLSWRVRVCRASWKGLLFVWGTLIIGIGVGTVANLNTTTIGKTGETGTSLTDILSKLFIVQLIRTFPFPIFFGLGFLVLLTLLSWLGSHEKQADMAAKQDRDHMLKRLRWYYEQMFSQSLQGAVQMELGLAKRPAAVQNRLSHFSHLPNQSEQLLSPDTSIIQAYEQAAHELLILGEPGAGKSTQLLELAHHLLQQAERDVTQPLPVLLPLSSWATKCPPLHEWLIEQVTLLYDVKKDLSQQWLRGKQLLPLLDGLDEVEASKRAACIAEINRYHHEHLQSLVVCSRTDEYEAAARHERLALHSAVVVQSLSKEQVDMHLEHQGTSLAALRTAVRKNSALQELATTPLMLRVLVLTYHGVSIRALSQKETQLRKQIWTDYVERMISHKGDVKRYPLSRTLAWLIFLAQQMRAHNQTIFFLEQLQSDWLPNSQQCLYRWSLRLIMGLVVGLALWLGGGLIAGLLGLLLGGCLGAHDQGRILPIEVVSWSWEAILKDSGIKLVSTLAGGLAFGMFFGLVFGQVCILVFGLFGGLLGPLVFGLSIGQLTKRDDLSPNEGIRRSGKNGLLIGLISGL